MLEQFKQGKVKEPTSRKAQTNPDTKRKLDSNSKGKGDDSAPKGILKKPKTRLKWARAFLNDCG